MQFKMERADSDNTVSADHDRHTHKTSENSGELTPQQKLQDFGVGFVCGLIFSVYSFYLLSFLGNKRFKRIGMFWGCFVSFLLILLVCFSFAAYTSYKHEIELKNKRLIPRTGRKLVLRSFSEFLKGTPDKFKVIRVTKIKRARKPHPNHFRGRHRVIPRKLRQSRVRKAKRHRSPKRHNLV